MRVFFKLYLFLVFIGLFSIGNAQNIEISGKIIDAESKEPIPFANIALTEIYKGTSSNSLGEFSFKVDSLPLILLISHLSFEPLEIEVKESKHLVIELTPGKFLLDELVIKGKGNDEFAYGLVTKAYYKIISQFSKNQYGKAFYRQISKNGDEYSELYEIFYDTKYSLNGVDDWAIQEGRYALKLSTADSFIYNKNFTLMVRLLTIVQPKTDDLIMPVSENVREQYFLSTERIQSVNNRRVAQIHFSKKEDVTFPAMEGELFIDVDSYNVLKIKGTITNDNLKFISLKGEKGSWKNYNVTCEIAFKPLEDEKLALDYMRLGQNFDYYFDGVFTNKVETRSFLMYYDYYAPPKRKKLGGRLLRFNRRDSDILDNIGYNQLFWDENIIVKRTPVEAEVTASFEAERAFGSIYINNKNQIVLEDYELDNDPFIVQVKQRLKDFDLPGKGEKAYIHHDKPFYVAGEKMWFKSYLVNMATNILGNRSDVLHVDLISPDGKLILSKLYQVKEGVGYGQLVIPKELESGLYILRAYSGWMKNFDEVLYYQEELEIFNASDISGLFKKTKKDSVNTLKFFPEGGGLVESIPVQVGFIAKNQFGEVIDIKGRLIDQDGRRVSTIKSEKNGPGSIFMLPKSTIQYRTIIMSDEFKQVNFPEVKSAGYSVMVNNLKPYSIDISVRGTMKLEGKKFYILVISNGILFDRRIGLLTRGVYKTEIPKSNLPSGITQLLLIDELGKLQCKRLVFLNQPEEASVKYYLAKKEFKGRERIDLVLELNDENGKPLNNANISVSVLDRDKISRDKYGRNIRSYYNLGFLSDNKLENPGEFFNDFDRETLKKLDWAMLSQQTVLPEIVSFDSLTKEENLSIIPASPAGGHKRGLALSGLAVEKKGKKPLSNGFITLISVPDPAVGSWYVKTDEKGSFLLTDLEISDSIRVVVKANNSLGEPVAIDMLFDKSHESRKANGFETAQIEVAGYVKRYLEQFLKAERELSSYHVTDQPVLEEPGFRSKKKNSPFGKPDQVVLIDNKYHQYSDMFQVFNSRFPGISVIDNRGEAKVKIRGKNNEPLLILDGMILYDPYGKGEISSVQGMESKEYFAVKNGDVKRILSEIDPVIIDRVEVIKDVSDKSSDIIKRANGIIAIYTKPGESPILQSQSGEMNEIMLPGLTTPEVFISPNYAKDTNTEFLPDLRSTIYWNPQVITNRRGRAKIGFYNSDDARNLQICIEGISKDGIPIYDIHEIGKKPNREQVK